MVQLILNYTLRASCFPVRILHLCAIYFADRCGILHGSHLQEGSEVRHIVTVKTDAGHILSK
jgi:hypothetical protein